MIIPAVLPLRSTHSLTGSDGFVFPNYQPTTGNNWAYRIICDLNYNVVDLKATPAFIDQHSNLAQQMEHLHFPKKLFGIEGGQNATP